MCFEEDPTKDSQKYKSIGYRRAAIMSPEISRGVRVFEPTIAFDCHKRFWFLVKVKMTDHNEEIEDFDSVQLKLDIKAMRVYVRMELFPRVKSIYSSNDLEHGGQIFHDFNKNCTEQVVRRGVSITVDRTRYIACLWRHALKERMHRNQLSTRRSGV